MTFSPWEACAPRTTHCFFSRRMNHLPQCHPLFASDDTSTWLRIRLLWISSSDDLYEISSFSWWDLSLVQNSIVLPRFWAWPQVHSLKTSVRYNTTQHPVFCFFFPLRWRGKKKFMCFFRTIIIKLTRPRYSPGSHGSLFVFVFFWSTLVYTRRWILCLCFGLLKNIPRRKNTIELEFFFGKTFRATQKKEMIFFLRWKLKLNYFSNFYCPM